MGLGHNERLVAMMGTWTEGLVGVSLIAIGLLGLKESLLDYDGPLEATDGGTPQSVGAAGVGATAAARGGGRAIFLNGVLHGFSWDGAPSLAPALALSSWRSVLWFLVAYCSGTMVNPCFHFFQVYSFWRISCHRDVSFAFCFVFSFPVQVLLCALELSFVS